MKKILALILALAMCLSLCACGSRNIASPGSANEETANDAVNSNADNNEAESNGDDAAVNNDSIASDESGAESTVPSDGSDNSGEVTETPESTEEFTYESKSASINISHGDGMVVSELGEGKAIVEAGDCRLYVHDVTSEFDPNSDQPESFLYEYAYNKCVDLVVDTYGEITEFANEYNLAPVDNEIYGYGANMTCNSDIQVYAFIKLVILDNGEGYAVMIGICDEYNASVFDNVEVQ